MVPYFFIYTSLVFSSSIQLFTVYLLSSGNVVLTYKGYNLTEHFALIFLFTLFVTLTRFLLARPHVLNLFSKNVIANFFATKFMPGLSLVMSTLTLIIFSGFRKLIFLQSQSLDSTAFWGDIMIHRRYDFQARADYFDRLMSESGITVSAVERARILKDSSSMSDIFNSVSQIKEDYIAVTEGLIALMDIAVITGSLIASFLIMRWLWGFLGDGGAGSGTGPKDIDPKQLELDERVSKIETLLNSLGDEVKGSLLSGYAMSVGQDPEQFGRVIGAIICGFKKSMDKHDSLIISTFKQIYGVELDPDQPAGPFSGEGHLLGGEGKNPYKDNILDNLDG